MRTRILITMLALAMVFALAACAEDANTDEGTEAPGDNGSLPAEDASGLRLANGLYDQPDGTVLAIGTLEWIDLEGGFYAITGAVDGDGNIAVIANADEFADELEALLGKTVEVIGTRYEGVSIRMAGPEVMIDTIREISDTPGIAE
jgi:hypothetical protein